MRKLLALALVAAMASSSFAYLPVSRWANWNNIQTNAVPAAYTIPASGQTNLGSYQNAATQGMFFGELDIISANPVELLDFEGNNLYTTWSNARTPNSASIAANNSAPSLTWRSTQFADTRDTLLLGLSGNPLGMFGIEGSRAGVVFQNYGAKSAVGDLNNSAASSEFVYYNVTEDNIFSVVPATRSVNPDRVQTQVTDLKGWKNTTNTQWNVGVAKKDMFVSGLNLGLGIAHTGKNVLLNQGGTQSYTERYVNDIGAVAAGMPASSTIGNTYTATYASDQPEQDSEYSTDLVAQGRYSVMDNLGLQGAVGLRFATFINPGGLINNAAAQQGVLSVNAMTVTASDDQNLLDASGTPTQYRDTGTSIVNASQMVTAGAQNLPTLVNLGANGIWNYNTANAAITSVSDKRTGMGPMIELQGTYTGIEKINVTGVLHYDMLKQPIDAEVKSRMYVNEADVISNAQTTSFVRDYNETAKSEGENTISNLDLGAKIDFKAMENLKLALGGFIRTNNNLSDFSKITFAQTQSITYSDGLTADNPGTVSATNQPGPAAARFGADAGSGEGTWTNSCTAEGSGQTKVESTSYVIPVGMEMPIYKDKWIFRAGTAYTMTKTKTTVSSTQKRVVATTNATPAGGVAVLPVYTENSDYTQTETTTYGETHTTSYNYGIQWNLNQNLTLAMNAVLDTNANPGTAPSDGKATIFDLDTYRNLSIQAVFHF